jgi:hypothetical protein
LLLVLRIPDVYPGSRFSHPGSNNNKRKGTKINKLSLAFSCSNKYHKYN